MRRPLALLLATLVMVPLLGLNPVVASSARADEPVSPTSIQLTADAPTFNAGQSVLLTAETDADVVDSPIVIRDEITNDVLKTCSSGHSCSVSVSFDSGDAHDYVATVNDLSSASVSVARASWTIHLEADQTDLASGGTTTLTATANQDVSDTHGAYAIEIIDEDGESLTHCLTGDTCIAHAVGAFKNGQHVHTYVAFVESASTAGSPDAPTDLQAESESVTLTEDSWKLALTLDKERVSAGDVVHADAIPTPPAGGAGSGYKTYLFVSETGELLATCDTSTDCTAQTTWRSSSYSFSIIGYIAAAGAPQSPADLTDVQAVAAVSADPNQWNPELRTDKTVIAAGQQSTVTATVSQSLDETDGNLALYIVDAAIDKIVKVCRAGSTCSLVSRFYLSGEDVYAPHVYIAIVAKDSADASTMATIPDYRAASSVLRIDWAPWPLKMEVTGPNQFTVTANQNLSLTNEQVSIYLLNQDTDAIEDECFSGTECILTASSPSQTGFAALVVKGPRGATTEQQIGAIGAGVIGSAVISSQGAGDTPWAPGAAQGPVQAGESAGGSNPAERPCQCGRADPVNTATGEYYDSTTDLALLGAGPALSVARSYSSTNGKNDGPFGHGWSFNWDIRLRVTVPGTSPGDVPRQVQVIQENGSTLIFTRDSNGTFQSLQRVLASLDWDATTREWTFTRKKTQSFVFTEDGQVLKAVDPNGNTVDVTHDADGRIGSITGSGGRMVTFEWSNQHIVGITDSEGREVHYVYDTAGDLVSVAAVDGGATTFGYNGEGLLTTVARPDGGSTQTTYDGSGKVAGQTDPTGRTTTFSYNGYWDQSGTGSTTTTTPDGTEVVDQYTDGLLTSQTADASGDSPRTTTYLYDASASVTSSTDSSGHTTARTYDRDGKMTSATGPLGQTTSYTYGGLNDVLSTTDPLGRTTSATYDSAGDQLTSTSPSGYGRSWTYNSDGTVASATDGRGKTSTYGYDSAGLPTSVMDSDGRITHTSYTAAGFVASQTDPGGHVMTYTRDSAGRVLTVTSPGQHTTTYTYDGDGNRLTVTAPSGKTSTAAYDVADERTTATDADGVVTTYGYDDAGRLASSTDADGHATTYGYDAFEEQTTVTDPDGHTTTTGYDADGNPTSVQAPSGATTTTDYDDDGQVTSTTDADGKTTSTTRDADGEVTATTDPLGRVTHQTYTPESLPDTTTSPDGSTVQVAYDADGHQTSRTNADGAVTTYSYDDAGLLTSKTEPGSKTTQYSYDPTGRLHVNTTPDGHTTTLTYDVDGQVATSHSDVAGSVDITDSYDVDGDRTSMSDSTGTSTDSYSDAGRLTSSSNGAGATVGYSYSSTGQLHTINYPGPGKTVTYGYDAAGQMTSLTDWNSHTTGFAWTDDGQLHTQDDPNGVTETDSYDPAGQTTQIQDTTTTDTLATYSYGWDDAGQLTSDSSTDPTGTGVDHTYSYDPTGQLHTISGSGTSGTVTATPAGQLTGTADGTTLAYNTAGELTSSTPTTGPATSYSSDGNGDRTSSTTAANGSEPAVTTGYGYDPAGNLTTVTLPDGTSTVSYDVDGDGLRQARTAGGATTGFVWDVDGTLPLLLDDGTHSYLYGPGNAPVAQVDDSTGTTDYLHGDLLGSTRLITDSDGTAAGAYQYSPYGTVTSHTGTTTRMQYTGAWTDPDTGLVYLQARDYDPTTGQFLQVDPALDTTHQPYTYVDNRSLFLSDPSGNDPYSAFEGFFSGLTGGATERISTFFSPDASCTYAHDISYDVSKTIGGYAGVAVSVILLRQGGEDPTDDGATYAVGRRGGGPNAYAAPHNIVGRPNAEATIAGRVYSGHSLDEMQSEGFVPSIVEHAITYGTERFGASLRIAYYDAANHITVVTSIDGRVITVTSGESNIR